jgi:hypothetical protein
MGTLIGLSIGQFHNFLQTGPAVQGRMRLTMRDLLLIPFELKYCTRFELSHHPTNRTLAFSAAASAGQVD